MKDCRSTPLYKYRKFDARTLSMLINQELYFACSDNLNDPHDCQISISQAILDAISVAKEKYLSSLTWKKINSLKELAGKSPEMEAEIKKAGIFSLSRTCRDMLMWTHYADEHKGLCIGLQVPENFISPTGKSIIGISTCEYYPNNPFVDYLVNLGVTEDMVEWEALWMGIFDIGLVGKHESWKYEEEVRIIRKEAGIEAFQPKDIVEIIFGLNMDTESRKTIIKLVSGPAWSHVQLSEMTKNIGSFGLDKVPHVKAGEGG